MFETSSIRVMTEDDLSMVLSWRNHPDVRRFMLSTHEITFTEHRNWFAQAKYDKTRRLLIIESSKQAFGFVQFSKVENNGAADWGFYLNPEAPKGSGRILGVRSLNFAFQNLNLKKVSGQVISSNLASIKFHRRMGFALEDVLFDKQSIDGTNYSLHCFGLLDADWHPENL